MMTISLSDIPAAVADYIKHNVTVAVTEVKHGISTVLQPNERGKFDVVVTNNGGVRLTNIIYELSISPDTIAKLVSPGETLMPARKGLDPSAAAIPNGDEVTKMFLFPFDILEFASVDPGHSVTNPELQVTTQKALGDATIKCTIHATVDQASLFPADQESSVVKRMLTVS
jgi:uncharacterized repeat protein (TIGR01451 family)